MSLIVGVDLAQANDYTAVVVSERVDGPSSKEDTFHIRHIERLPLHMAYPRQATHIGRLLDRLDTDAQLVVDATGVGKPVVDLLRDSGLKLVAATITAGEAVTREGGDYRVPKATLVAEVQVLLQTSRLKIAKDLDLAEQLVNELLAFKVSINERGHARFGNDVGQWRQGDHDDLVLATALAVWWGRRATGYTSHRVPKREAGAHRSGRR